jgi:nitrite reductase (NADH) small subunit
MRIFILDLNEINQIKVGENHFFIKRDDLQTLAIPAKCPHRGGPLQYGKQSDDNKFIVCPWHENKLKVCHLTRQSLCTVKVMDKLKFLVPKEIQINIWKEESFINFGKEIKSE